ncbi:NrfD/PsrC family molybdoenzyme membrane anchor subunit [Marinoscillum sp. MHG1-6]|uniref:NrfD/PsrC family molybdoenzyme membrane anchor subunit n=1 Tax=Marinoscillum sp. MHG1-6 TaxID=2959627 RepID=UPI0021572D36|nr:NrfD/PsrC family molybdoenzyme membrane anchor subunit [Marinoscillum sp. MHG1-6]
MKNDNNIPSNDLKALMPDKFGRVGILWTWSLLLLFAIGVAAYIYQIRNGLGITAMRDYASWGIYISNFVFFVAISLVGSLVSAILHLAGVSWGRPLNRIAEIIAVSAIVFAGLIIIVDMGRPDRLWHLFAYGRLQSPIIWDVLVITTYLVLSLLLLYFPLLPDLAIIGKEKEGTFLGRLYTRMSLNWTGSEKQKMILKRAVKVIAISIIPMAFAIHTVTSWLFATTYRPGWDSTNFGPYFVSGAFLAGAAGVVIAMFFYRRYYQLEKYLTVSHFDKMGRLIVMLSLLYIYFNINEYLVPGFKMKATEEEHLVSLFTGEFSTIFWAVIGLGMILPTIVLLIPKGRQPVPLVIMSILIVVGAWFKRYLIVTPTLLHPFLPIEDAPESYSHYIPTIPEVMITVGSLAGALLIMTFFTRFLPIIPISEEEEPVVEVKSQHMGAMRIMTCLLILGMALPIQAQQKQKVKLNLNYYHEMGQTPYLTTRVRTRGERGYEPVEGVIVNLFLYDETKMGMLGNITSDVDGEGTFILPDKFQTALDTLSELNFIARILDDPNYKDKREELSITRATLDLKTSEIDSIRTIQIVLSGPDGEPAAEEQVYIYVKRMFGQMPIGDKYNITDDEGTITILLKDQIPGDTEGNLELCARVSDHDSYGTISITKKVNWGAVPSIEPIHLGRSLWGTRDKAPVWLLLVANVTIIGFWTVIGYLLFQLYMIRQST